MALLRALVKESSISADRSKPIALDQRLTPPAVIIQNLLNLDSLVIHLTANFEIDIEVRKIGTRQSSRLEVAPTPSTGGRARRRP